MSKERKLCVGLLLMLGLAGARCGPGQEWVDERLKTAVEHYQNRRLDAAYEVGIEIIDRAPDSAAARVLVARIEYYRKNYEAATRHCEDVLENNPDHYGALLWLARIWSNQSGKERAAMALVERALRVETRSSEVWYLKGLLHERLDEVADAITAYQIAVADNRIALAHVRLSELYGRARLDAKRDQHAALARAIAGQDLGTNASPAE